jgi:ParB family chromosome partitioning protein
MTKRKKTIDYNLVKEVTKSASLSEQQYSQPSKEQIVEIPVNDLIQNPYQPRIVMTDEKINELADSIKDNGLIQPITVVQEDDKYIIIYGHRRTAAHLRLGLEKIKAIVLDKVEHAQLAILPLVENLQRESMDPIETAISMKRIINEKIVRNQNELAEKVGLTKSWISKMMSVLKLPNELLDVVRNEGYSDITVLAALNKLNKDHLEIYKIIKNLDRKAALKYIKERSENNITTATNRIVTKGNKVTINLKGLSSTKTTEIKQYIDKINNILNN